MDACGSGRMSGKAEEGPQEARLAAEYERGLGLWTEEKQGMRVERLRQAGGRKDRRKGHVKRVGKDLWQEGRFPAPPENSEGSNGCLRERFASA